jgi:hypothetical protein
MSPSNKSGQVKQKSVIFNLDLLDDKELYELWQKRDPKNFSRFAKRAIFMYKLFLEGKLTGTAPALEAGASDSAAQEEEEPVAVEPEVSEEDKDAMEGFF